MSWFPISFGAPLVLWGLLALPAIWWLLRLTPPRPQQETFPPFAILARILRRDETPDKSPWWLTLLRLALAGLVILALANPVLNPDEKLPLKSRILTLIIDNGWSSAPDWDHRIATATRLIEDARDSNALVVLALTAEAPSQEIGPFDVDMALTRLNAATPRPVPVDRAAVFPKITQTLSQLEPATLAFLTDGIQGSNDSQALQTMLNERHANVLWFEPQNLSLAGLNSSSNTASSFQVKAIRPDSQNAPATITARALDDQGRSVGETVISFAANEYVAEGAFNLPFELRNDFASITLDGQRHAGSVLLLDENARRRRIGLLAQGETDQAQPLLSPLYYIRHALSPFADLIEASTPDLSVALPQMLEQQPAIIIMADIGTLPVSVQEPLLRWVESGGMLVRFAGPRLAATDGDEDLLPVRLRTGERALGGTLSWSEPQSVSDFPSVGPFADLPPPAEVTVTRQVLAEPSSGLVDHTWANLTDGTPLVTGADRGNGKIVLFHVTSEATWSNLPISGTFLEMLRRLVQLSHNIGDHGQTGTDANLNLPPYRMISADGVMVPPDPQARPLLAGLNSPVTLENPPGLYGSQEGSVPHNLFNTDSKLTGLQPPEDIASLIRIPYETDTALQLKPALLMAALVLLFLDTLAMLWLNGQFRRLSAKRKINSGILSLFLGLICLLLIPASSLQAQEAPQVSDAEAIEALSTTHIAYVITGNSSVDAISRAGIQGLSRFIASKTAFEPGEPAAIDIATDELAFYPLIYWPIDVNSPMPDEHSIARVGAYMQQGGTVLFDTRDQYSTGFSLADATTPETQRLREILSGLDIPPLEPVPVDHVLTKTFYILDEFPGRYRGGELWVEASTTAQTRTDRPVRTGDGVSPIMITSNDLAAAWAIDASGRPLLPTLSADVMQREYAFRAGVNILIYMLTGNYKSDQVHVPALLERLGQ